ncbi:hypothetical protein Tco_0461219, partial [Tanacetum coccineum]
PNGRSGGKLEGGFWENVISSGGNGGRGGSIAGRGEVGGVENKSSMGSKFMANGEECLDGWVEAGGGEVKGGGVDFGVSRTLLGEIPRESGGEELGLMEEPFDNRWVVIEYDREVTPVEGWRNNKNEH